MAIQWNLDPSHSEVFFKVKHMVISTVTGEFQQFEAQVQSDDDAFSNVAINFAAQVDSLNTKNKDRDAHLKSADFFDAPNFPLVKFTSTGNIVDGKLNGELEMRGVKKPITLDVEFNGVIKDPYGLQRAGFELSGKVNRKDFGLAWSALTEAGGLVVADEVRISANVEFTKAQ